MPLRWGRDQIQQISEPPRAFAREPKADPRRGERHGRLHLIDRASIVHAVPDEINVVVMRGTRNPGWPKTPWATPGDAVPITDVFTREYAFDAFVLAHEIPRGQAPYRLTKDYLEGGTLRMALLFADLDAHHLTGDELESWKQEQLRLARQLFAEHPGLAYPTRSGIRLAWRIACDWSEYEHLAACWYSELDARGFRGIDSTAGSFGRHMRLPFIIREGVREKPTIEGELAYLRWRPEQPAPARQAPRPRPRARRPASDSWAPGDPVVAMALAMRLAAPGGAGKWHVYCPRERHNGGELTSSTVVWDDGRFCCLKASCRDVTYADWVASIAPPPVSGDWPREGVPATLRRGGIERRLASLDITTGAGKSHSTRALLAPGLIHEGIKSVLLSSTNALATQHRHATGAHQVAGISAQIEDREVCQRPNSVAGVGGLSARYTCSDCSHRQKCQVAKGVGDKQQGNVSSHAMLHKYLPVID